MLKPDSPYWNWEIGVCTKHYLPSVPCPSCLAKDDEDLYEGASSEELMLMADLDAFENNPW